MTVWNQIAPEYGSNLWNEALNKRLGTQVILLFDHFNEMPLFIETINGPNTVEAAARYNKFLVYKLFKVDQILSLQRLTF